jgi:hypothetical protein
MPLNKIRSYYLFSKGVSCIGSEIFSLSNYIKCRFFGQIKEIKEHLPIQNNLSHYAPARLKGAILHNLLKSFSITCHLESGEKSHARRN